MTGISFYQSSRVMGAEPLEVPTTPHMLCCLDRPDSGYRFGTGRRRLRDGHQWTYSNILGMLLVWRPLHPKRGSLSKLRPTTMSIWSPCASPNGDEMARVDSASAGSSSRRKLCMLGGVIFVAANIVVLYVLHFVDHPGTSYQTRRRVLLLAGDSLTEKGSDPSTEGWVCQLQNRYVRAADVLQRGLSGYTTKTYLQKAVPVLEHEMAMGELSPSIITVWLGANDAALPDGTDSAKHVDLVTYSANLKAIVTRFRRQAPDSEVLLITPPFVNDAARLALADGEKVDRSNKVTGQYARACVESAQSLGVPVLDLYSFFNAMSESERNASLVDGLHFTAQGNSIVDEQLHAKLTTEFPEMVARLESETWQLPDSNILD